MRRVLLDECVPVPFRHALPGADVFTVRFMGWRSVPNGRLLALAKDAGFEVLVTADRALPSEQDIARIGIGVVVVPTNRLDRLRAIADRIAAAIDDVRQGEVRAVALG